MATSTIAIGIPREVKDREHRVALMPAAVATLTGRGHQVRVESGAGAGAGADDAAYRAAGAEVVTTPEDVWAADLVVKVKEPQPEEYGLLRTGQALFSYLHLAAEPVLAGELQRAGVRAFAFETLEGDAGLPLLAPMSEVAGRAAAIIGAFFLSSAGGGSGTLLGGAAGVPPARVVVIGLGVAGTMAARGCRGLGGAVTGVDVDLERLQRCRLDGTVDATLASEPALVAELVAGADLVIGAALVPGARAPLVVSEEMVIAMPAGSVVIDLAIDQGGCVETARPTSLSAPTFRAHDVVHYCVTNVPGQFPRTASAALSAAVGRVLPQLAEDLGAGRAGTSEEHPLLRGARNVDAGEIVHAVVAAELDAAGTDVGPGTDRGA